MDIDDPYRAVLEDENLYILCGEGCGIHHMEAFERYGIDHYDHRPKMRLRMDLLPLRLWQATARLSP